MINKEHSLNMKKNETMMSIWIDDTNDIGITSSIQNVQKRDVPKYSLLNDCSTITMVVTLNDLHKHIYHIL